MTNLKFLGKGLSYPFRFDNTGASGTSTSATESEGVLHVSQGLIQVLRTVIGERFMKRDFGSDLQQLVFSPIQPQLQHQILNAIRKAVTTWEKRVSIQDLNLLEQLPEQGKIVVSIGFKIISTNVEGNLVYPFYLQSPTQGPLDPSGVIGA